MSSIYSVERFFKNNGLDWSIEIEKELCRIGVEYVEHIKLVSSDEWDSLFTNSSIVIKRLATKVYNDHLKGGEINPQKCAIELGINSYPANGSPVPQIFYRQTSSRSTSVGNQPQIKSGGVLESSLVLTMTALSVRHLSPKPWGAPRLKNVSQIPIFFG